MLDKSQDVAQSPEFEWEKGDDAFPLEGEQLTGDRRTEARLCAVQVVFQAKAMGAHVHDIAGEFLPNVKKRKADKKLFALITEESGVGADRYEAMIAAHLLEGWSLDRLDPVHFALLWAACAELTANIEVGPKIILNEYLNISKGFAKAEDVAFINAALDRLARKIRGDF